MFIKIQLDSDLPIYKQLKDN